MAELDDIVMGGGDEDPVQEQEAELPPADQADVERNPELAGAVAACRRKTDHTDDRIDWKRVNQEDTRRALDVAHEKKWNVADFVTEDVEVDTEWCFACRAKQKNMQANGILKSLNDFNGGKYRTTQMIALLDGLQDLYITHLLSRVKKQDRVNGKFWFRRSIYDHIHDHNKTAFVNACVQQRNYGTLKRELWDARTYTDHLTGATSLNFKAIPLLFKTDAQCGSLDKVLEKFQQNGTPSSF